MNEEQKYEFVRELKKTIPSVYSTLAIDDCIVIHKLRKQKGFE